jgi:glutathione S-transferase
MILYHALPSANSERVRMALFMKGLQYEAIALNLAKREQKTPEFLRLNPYGKVPVLVDEGNVLFESCIINDYLDERYPNPRLMPNDPYVRARGRMLVDYGLNHMHEAYWTLRGSMRIKDGSRDLAAASRLREALGKELQYLENALAHAEFFLGEFSLVDINLWPRLSRMRDYGVLPNPSLPRIVGWLNRMEGHPSVKALHE